MLDKIMGMSKEEGMQMMKDQGPKVVESIKTLVEVGLQGEVAKIKKFTTDFRAEGELTTDEVATIDEFEASLDTTILHTNKMLALVFGKIVGWVEDGTTGQD